MAPESTSPVPAVASAPEPPRLTPTSPSGVGDERVVALEQHDGLAAPGGVARVEQTAGAHGVGVDLEQAGELAGVWGQHGRRLARGEVLEPPRMRVEAVGVEQQRQLDLRGHGAGEGEGPVGSARPGPSTIASAR